MKIVLWMLIIALDVYNLIDDYHKGYKFMSGLWVAFLVGHIVLLVSAMSKEIGLGMI